MMRYYCDRCGFEMTKEKYERGYRLPDPEPKYNAWDEDESEDPSGSLIICEVCKRAYISFLKGDKKS